MQRDFAINCFELLTHAFQFPPLRSVLLFSLLVTFHVPSASRTGSKSFPDANPLVSPATIPFLLRLFSVS
jgi:hypothetical protein